MKTSFKRAKLATAMMFAAGAALTSPTSFAVNLSDNGLGEVGIVPYYTVRNGYDTYVSVVNTSDEYTVAFKIRFRESRNSRDVRDFNVFLSPNDVWNAVVTMKDDGMTPVVQTADNSCTAPALLGPPTATMDGMRGITFTTFAFDGTSPDYPNRDAGPQTIERTQEGYVEIIEMGVAKPESSSLAAAAVHNASGVPANCNLITNTYLTAGNEPFQDQFNEPLNVLKVSAYMLRVDLGVGMGLPVTTLANFFNPNGTDNPGAPSSENLMETPETDRPNLSFADPVSDQVVDVLGAITDTGFAGALAGADAVSSLITATAVINEYAIGGAANALNDWVITFPTKNFYVDTQQYPTAPIDPFEERFRSPGQSCVTVDFNYFDREEKSILPKEFCEEYPDAAQCNLNFSPIPPGLDIDPEIARICTEVQTLSFADQPVLEPVLGEGTNYGVPLGDTFTSGWMRLRFTETEPGSGSTAPIQGSYTYYGLPTVGFSIKTLENGVSDSRGVLNYGASVPHSYERVVEE